MFLSFNHLSAHCHKEDDRGNDGEYYWTWQVRTGDIDELSLASGFTEGLEATEGYRIEENMVRDELYDPKFIIKLPDVSKPGESKRISIRFYCFEHDSDRDTVRIKTLFSNSATQFLIDLAKQNQLDRETAKKKLVEFLDTSKGNGLSDLITSFGSYASIPVSLIKVPGIVYNLYENVLRVLLKNGDDMVGARRIDLFYFMNQDKQVEYRWQFEKSIGDKKTEIEKPLLSHQRFISANGKEEVSSIIQLQIVPNVNLA